MQMMSLSIPLGPLLLSLHIPHDSRMITITTSARAVRVRGKAYSETKGFENFNLLISNKCFIGRLSGNSTLYLTIQVTHMHAIQLYKWSIGQVSKINYLQCPAWSCSKTVFSYMAAGQY